MDDREIVAAIRARLVDRLGKDRYEVWFGSGTGLAVGGDKLVITVRTQFFKDWLRRHFHKDIEATVEAAVGRPLTLEYRIAAAPVEVVTAVEQKPAAISARCPASNADRAHAVDRTPRRRFHCLESFVVGNSNCLAHKAAQMAAEKPGAYSPLLVHGPSGTGKTHLLEGICTAFRKHQPRAATIFLSAEQFTSNFIEALHGSGLPSFRRKHRGLELLIIDDVQFFAGKRATLNELVHTTDELLRSGRQLVFAADRALGSLKLLGNELVARLSGGMVCRLETPDFSTRLGIVRQMAARLHLSVPDDVQSYIATHFTTQSRELARALKRLHAASMTHDKPITLALAEEALAEMVDHQGRAVKLVDIEKAVCDVCGLEEESLQSGRKGKQVSHPRMLAMYLARKHTRAPLSEIGSYFGRRSHSTVISAQKKIESWMAAGSPTDWTHNALSFEETIRRIEEQLRAG